MTDSQQLEIIAEDSEILESLNSQSIQNILFRNNRFQPYPRRLPSEMNQNSSNAPINDNMSRQDLQLLLNSIPEFSPGKNLSIFINEVDNLISHLHGRLNTDLEFCLNFAIRSRILNEARDFISFQNAKDWPSIRRALLQRYGDQRNEELLITAISQCVQKRNESYLDYYCRISKNLNDLLQHLTLNIEDSNLLTYKKYEAEKLCLKTFQVGILEPYRSFISNFELNNIEECINKCKFYDNRKQEWEYSEFLRRSQENKKPLTNNQFKQPQNSNNYVTKFSQNNSNQNPQNIVFRNNPPLRDSQKYFTNQQVFGTKPSSNLYKLNQEPTPMSICTRNTKPTPMSISTRNSKFPQRQVFNVQFDPGNNDHEFENEPQYSEEDTINSPENYEENYYPDENFHEAPPENPET